MLLYVAPVFRIRQRSAQLVVASPPVPSARLSSRRLYPRDVLKKSRPSGMPSQPLLGFQTGSIQVEANKPRQPAEVSPGFLGRFRNDRDVESAADRLGDIAQRHAFFGNGVIARARFLLLDG